jgi:hypothetical protein
VNEFKSHNLVSEVVGVDDGGMADTTPLFEDALTETCCARIVIRPCRIDTSRPYPAETGGTTKSNPTQTAAR